VIQVEIRLDPQGALREFRVSGHAGAGSKGEDLVCAAVSVLFRTAARLLQLQPDVAVRGNAAHTGDLFLRIDSIPPKRRDWLGGITGFLLQGALDLQEENPQAISVRVDEGEV
jgi:uncharacterized protein YsxB (DUF464 family)